MFEQQMLYALRNVKRRRLNSTLDLNSQLTGGSTARNYSRSVDSGVPIRST